MDLFGKKRIAELEKENESLKKVLEEKSEELEKASQNLRFVKKEYQWLQNENCKDLALINECNLEKRNLNNRIKQLENEYRSLKAGSEGLKSLMEGKNKKVRELEDRLRAESWEHMETSKELDRLEKENKCMTNRLKSIEELFKDIDGVFICDFRKARGRALNASNKRIRYKELNKMATSMEKIIKEITKSLTC